MRQTINKIVIGLLLVLLFVPVFVSAADSPPGEPAQNLSGARQITNEFAGNLGYATKDVASPEVIVGRIVNIVLSFLGTIFLVLMVVGGIQWLTAGGNEEKVTAAKSLIMQAIIGLVIVFAAFMISYFVLGLILKAVVG
ncbi:hypothetical protein HY933_04310 [Candidatus Falkowbacteria bacterium]|nr:hypothetical protein [Candidatus Falkowbacteria bacterium]